MNILAAQLPDPSTMQSIGWLVLSLAGLGGIVFTILGCMNAWRDLRNNGEISPQPLKVKEVTRYARFEELCNLRNEFEQSRDDLRKEIEKLEHNISSSTNQTIAAGEDRARRIYQRIESSAAGLDSKFDTKIDNMMREMMRQIIDIVKGHRS